MALHGNHRWARKLVVGLACVAVAAPAATAGTGVDNPYGSSGVPGDPYYEPALGPTIGADHAPAVSGFVSPSIRGEAVKSRHESPQPVRPDDRADRSIAGNEDPLTQAASVDRLDLGWDTGVAAGIAALALGLVLGMALMQRRRPRLAAP